MRPINMLLASLFSPTARAFSAGGQLAPRTVASRADGARRLAVSAAMAASGPVCVVTGASRGLGKAIALALGGEGCRVVVNYAASAGAAEKVVEEIKVPWNTRAAPLRAAHPLAHCSSPPNPHAASPQTLGGDGVAVQADMSTEEGVKTLFAAVAKQYEDPVGVLVNNAGITRDTLALRMKSSQWNEVINCNLNGVFFSSQAALKVMMKKRAGRIINIASVVGKIGNVGQVNYAAAKAGVIGMTMSMAREGAARGVTVNAVAPGYIASDMTDELPEAVVAEVTKMIPAGRFGKPEEVAGLVKCGGGHSALCGSAQRS